MKKMLLILCTVLIGLLTMGAAPSVKSYSETFRMAPDGSGEVSARVELADLIPGTTDVPLTTWKGLQAVSWQGVPAGIEAQPVLKGEAPCLRLVVGPGAPAGFVIEMTYAVPMPKAPAKGRNKPAGETSLGLRFLNGGRLPIGDYSLKLLLPEGRVVHSVQEKLPKGKGGEGAQVTYIKEEKRQGLTLQAKKLAFGDTASVQLTVMDEQKSPVLIILLGLVAVLYMVVFRDIVRPPAQPK